MFKRNGFTLVELLVVITILGTLIAMAVPNYRNARQQARAAAMKMNCHNVQVVVETFHLEESYYADDFTMDGYGAFFPGGVPGVELGRLPTNPWTGAEMTPADFPVELYDNDGDNAITVGGGPNDVIGYQPGQMLYQIFTPGIASTPTQYGLVGIQHAGLSIRSFDAQGDVVVFVLHN